MEIRLVTLDDLQGLKAELVEEMKEILQHHCHKWQREGKAH